MSDNSNDFYQRIRDALQQENQANTAGSPQCLAPEQLWEWGEQQDAHPQATQILGHYITCVYCRRQYAALCEIRALTAENGPHTVPIPQNIGTADRTETAIQSDVRRLSGKVRAWARELLDVGTLAPVPSLRASLERLRRVSLVPDAGARSVVAPTDLTSASTLPTDLRPAFTAVRSAQPTLHWTGTEAAQQYAVTVARPQEKTRPRSVWTGSVETAAPLTLPQEAGLEPGNVYLWQVIARSGEQEQASLPAAFLVLSEAMQRQAEAMEQEAGASPLARITVYTAYGLYEEALQAAQDWNRHNPDTAVLRIQTDLLRRLHRIETGD